MPGLGEARLSDRVASLDALRGFDMFWIIGGEALVRGLQAVRDTSFNPQYYGSGDSMGVLSTLPAACSILLGVFAGYWLRSARSAAQKARGLLLGGLACLGLGYLWSLAFPIIKHIWTSSYVLWAGGWSLLLLAAKWLVLRFLYGQKVFLKV